MKRKLGKLISAICLTLSAPALANDQFKFEVTPYFWYAGLEGDITVNSRSVDFEKSSSDLLNALEVAGSVRVGTEYNRFVFGMLFDYFSLSTDEIDVEDQPQNGTLDTKSKMTELMAGYRVDGWSDGQSFIFGVGLRNLRIENDLYLNNGDSVSHDEDINDAMLFVVPSVPVFPSKINGLRFNSVLGIGTGDSDFAYELFPQLQYQINENVTARFGYRTVGWKFKGDSNGDNELNISKLGLIAGIGVTF
jgi:opacity protein-like surface antigen